MKRRKDKKNFAEFELASTEQRLINYIIDSVFYFGFIILFLTIIRYLSKMEVSSFLSGLLISEDPNYLKRFFFGVITTTLFYLILEYSLKGKTIGKFITNTRAVTSENEIMDFKSVLIRSICRRIPFDSFSFLGDVPRGWHDRISETKVISEKK
ncbi:RDD family protein [Winogradskyella aquimaris]|uniref:RDD family protein n=1 Tax=Winogradskyella aquimaris TaxID=864074 RepID=A0ABU5EUX5_9FLAO|nr:RDD family protein [Winogradskyella aquimaris]MDY2588527.1 RDD family protein [Winogradskyella aquimaris]